MTYYATQWEYDHKYSLHLTLRHFLDGVDDYVVFLDNDDDVEKKLLEFLGASKNDEIEIAYI